MRLPILLLTLPVFASSPLKVKVQAATLTTGAGVEPKGAMPSPRFHLELSLAGGPKALHPEFRVWRVREADAKALERGASPRHLHGGTGQLEAKTLEGAAGTWHLSGPWSGNLQADDRLLVEVWQGKRRLGWTLTALQELLLPESAPRPDRSGN